MVPRTSATGQRGADAPSPARRRSAAPPVPPGGGLKGRFGRRPKRRGRARPLADPATGGLFFRSAGAISTGASLAPALWGGPKDGSLYQCAADETAELRSPPAGSAAGEERASAGAAGAGRGLPGNSSPPGPGGNWRTVAGPTAVRLFRRRAPRDSHGSILRRAHGRKPEARRWRTPAYGHCHPSDFAQQPGTAASPNPDRPDRPDPSDQSNRVLPSGRAPVELRALPCPGLATRTTRQGTDEGPASLVPTTIAPPPEPSQAPGCPKARRHRGPSFRAPR